MLDRSLPYAGVLIVNEDPAVSCDPALADPILPAGYRLSGYQPGYEVGWAELHVAVDQFESVDEGIAMYKREFFTDPEKQRTHCLFILDETERVVAVTSLWDGDHYGEILPRIHWVAVHPDAQGLGLAKYLLAQALDLHRKLYGEHACIYLATQTWSWRAIHLYKRFGFEPYLGPKPVNWRHDGDYETNNRYAWEQIEAKLSERA